MIDEECIEVGAYAFKGKLMTGVVWRRLPGGTL
jgi:hypothetical protein